MNNILHNAAFVIIYVIVAAACLAAIIIMDMKQARETRKHTEAVKENTRIYRRMLDRAEQEREAYEQYRRAVESYEETVNRNTEIYGRLVRLLGQDQTGGQGVWKE